MVWENSPCKRYSIAKRRSANCAALGHSYHGIKLMPTFHPAYLLRNPADKKLVWEDIKLVIKEMRGEDT